MLPYCPQACQDTHLTCPIAAPPRALNPGRKADVKRVEGLSKLTGRELYVDDLPVEGCLWGATVRSPVSRGRIRGIRVR